MPPDDEPPPSYDSVMGNSERGRHQTSANPVFFGLLTLLAGMFVLAAVIDMKDNAWCLEHRATAELGGVHYELCKRRLRDLPTQAASTADSRDARGEL